MWGKVIAVVGEKLKESSEKAKNEMDKLASEMKNDLSEVEEKAKAENADYKKEV